MYWLSEEGEWGSQETEAGDPPLEPPGYIYISAQSYDQVRSCDPVAQVALLPEVEVNVH